MAIYATRANLRKILILAIILSLPGCFMIRKDPTKKEKAPYKYYVEPYPQTEDEDDGTWRNRNFDPSDDWHRFVFGDA
jgi:hypothetical protein